MENNILEIEDLYTLFDKCSLLDQERVWSKITISLRTLNLNSHHINLICDLLKFNQSDSLTVNFENNPGIKGEHFKKLFKILDSFSDLKCLSLFFSYTGFSDEEAPLLISLIQAHKDSLADLRIGLMGASITDKTVEDLIPVVSEFELDKFYFGIGRGTFETSYKVLISLCKDSKINKVNINAFFIEKYPKDLMALISEAAKSNDNLSECIWNMNPLKQ